MLIHLNHPKPGRYIMPLMIPVLLLYTVSTLPAQTRSMVLRQGNLTCGAERTELYFPEIRGKAIAILANPTSRIRDTHLVDSLAAAGMNIRKIFSPEHGFRAEAGAGEKVADQHDPRTGLPVISLYGKHLRPTREEMQGLDAVIFDIQDVGVRFYTYASTLQYMMEACARSGIPLILLDRPNPNGHYIDGPVLEPRFASFVGLNPIPLVHGLTLGEYARMIEGEGWLGKGVHCDLRVIPVEGYSHEYLYQLTVPPSPNLPNMASVYLYPSLGLFEGTIVSVGRGTDKPFQLIGHPSYPETGFSFLPLSKPGFSLDPPHEKKRCNGYDLADFGEGFLRNYGKLYLFWLISMYEEAPDKKSFFNSFFDKLAGTDKLREQIRKGVSEDEIRNSWKESLDTYRAMRKKYLLYPDFE